MFKSSLNEFDLLIFSAQKHKKQTLKSVFFQMAKRKIKCDVNDFILDYLKKAKCEKTLNLLDKENLDTVKKTGKVFAKFVEYLKAQTKNEMKKEDDLGFEINFAAYQPDIKVRPTDFIKISSSRKSSNSESKCDKRNKNEKKMEVPKEFIKTIENLGMKKEDADILYKTNINWTVVYSNNKIYCTEHGCDFFTKIDNDELTNHMINIHKYGEYPCHDPYCDFIAVSKKNLNYHNRMHTKRFDKDFCHKCPKTNCQGEFHFR